MSEEHKVILTTEGSSFEEIGRELVKLGVDMILDKCNKNEKFKRETDEVMMRGEIMLPEKNAQ